VGVILAIVLWSLGQWYWRQKQIEARRRYVDLGAQCAAAADFLLDTVSDGPEEPHPSRTFKHKFFPELVLYVHSNGWNIYEAGSGLKSTGLKVVPEPEFKPQRGDTLSASDFVDAVEAYRRVVEYRRRTLGWGCWSDLRSQRTQSS
jgi:hypothetical protein